MAARKKANGQEPKEKATKSDRRKKAPDAVAGMGHNLNVIRKEATRFADRYNVLLDEKEKLNGECMADVKELLEEAANELGCPRKIVRKVMKEQREEIKRKAEEAEMEPDEKDSLETLRDALGLLADLPLGIAAQDKATSNNDAEERPLN